MLDIIITNKRFAGEAHCIRDWITPSAFEVQNLYEQLATPYPHDTLINCWQWIDEHFLYPTTICGKPTDAHELIAFGRAHYRNMQDFWEFAPEAIAQANYEAMRGGRAFGDCETRAYLVVSVLRNQLSSGEIYAVLGNYLASRPLGHAWVKVLLDNNWYIIDPTQRAGTPASEPYYDTYCIFNDIVVLEFKPLEEILAKVDEQEKIAHLRGKVK